MNKKRREYTHGSKFAFWRWKDIETDGVLYMRRLYFFHCPLFTIMANMFYHPDKQRHSHDHPASFISFILKGNYIENRSGYYIRRRWLNIIKAEDSHRIVEVKEGGCISLVFTSRKIREWGFWTEEGWVQWQEYARIYHDQ